MKAFVVLGGNSESRWSKVLELFVKNRNNLSNLSPLSDLDTHILSGPESIKIEEIRNLERILSLKPFNQPPKIAIIQADLMTTEAQTALLKTLEEPPGETIFFLHAPNGNLLLPTILSRCQTVQLPAESEISLSPSLRKTEEERLDQLLKASPVQRLLLADEWGINKNKEEAIKFCQIQLILWREKMFKNPATPTTLTTLKSLSLTLTHLSTNVNPKLALDNLLLSLPLSPLSPPKLHSS